MDALNEAILRLLKRQDQTEQRLGRIEAALGLGEVTAPAEVARAPEAAPPVAIQSPPEPPLPPAAPIEPVEANAAATDHPRKFETQVGLTWISRIGAITLLFCVAFIFKYAIDNQWIGETGRIVLGILAALACLGAGGGMWRGGHQTYAQAISGLGIAILYLSFYASFAFYHLLPQSVPFALMTLVTAFSGALALRYDAPAIAALGLLGGYLTPVLLSTGEDRPVALFGYILLLDLGDIALVRARRWLKFELLAFGATVVLYFAWLVTHFTPEKQVVGAVFALMFYALFVFTGNTAIAIASQILVTAALAGIWESKPGPFLATTTAVAAVGLVAADIQKRSGLAPVALGAFWLAYAAWYHAFLGETRLSTILGFLTVAFLLFFAWPPWRVLVRKAEIKSPELLVLSLNALAYYAAAYNLLATDQHAYLGLFTVAVAGLYLALGMELWRQLPAEGRDTRPALLSLGVALTLVTLAAPIQFTGFRITIGWAVEAVSLTWIGKRAQSERLIQAALCVFVLVLFRLWLIDAWVYATPDYIAIWNARFLTFAVAAAGFWGAAYWIPTGVRAIATYIAGHVVLLWGLMLEVGGWAERTAAPQNLASLESTTISILMATYALGLIGTGVVSRTSINRILGLGLIGLAVVKLYFYDVWLLVRIYRIAAFAVLGALLLVTSFLYSRYREKIEAWWSDDQAAP